MYKQANIHVHMYTCIHPILQYHTCTHLHVHVPILYRPLAMRPMTNEVYNYMYEVYDYIHVQTTCNDISKLYGSHVSAQPVLVIHYMSDVITSYTYMKENLLNPFNTYFIGPHCFQISLVIPYKLIHRNTLTRLLFSTFIIINSLFMTSWPCPLQVVYYHNMQ